jgi:putative transposase
MHRGELLLHVRRVHAASHKRYGSPRVYHTLRREGVRCGRHLVARLMREYAIRGRCKPAFRTTTCRNKEHPIAGNILARNFSPKSRDRSWVADITYLRTKEGWQYLAIVLDLYSRRVVGWSMSAYLDEQLALDALEMAVAQRRPKAGLIHHSDQGCQYTASRYRKALEACGMVASMSRKGNCWDNSVAESFFHSLKTELVAGRQFSTRKEAYLAVGAYIDNFYNSWRLHSTLGFTTPIEHEIALSV